MMTAIKLINISVTSHSYLFFGVSTLKIYSPRKLQVCNTVLLSTVTTLYVRVPEK